MKYLKEVCVEEMVPGIYRFRIWRIEVIIIVQSRLKGKEYYWLKNLSLHVDPEEFDQMARQAIARPEDNRRDELIQFIGETNPYLWKEKEGRIEEISAATSDIGERRKLYQKYGI